MKANRLPYSPDSGFQIPLNYMEDLEARILERVVTEEILLAGKPKKAFLVPEDYFDTLEDKLLAGTLQENKSPSKVINLFNQEAFFYVAGVAAVIIAILLNPVMQQPDPFTMENLDMLSLENYIDETIDFSTPEVSGMISEEVGFAPGPPKKLNQQAVMDYLHENIEEPSLIFNED